MEFVATTRVSNNLCVVGQLPPQIRNSLIDRAGTMIHFELPHVRGEFIPRNDAASIGAQIIEQALFGWSEHTHKTAKQRESFGSRAYLWGSCDITQ
jgi:hypothetical protein